MSKQCICGNRRAFANCCGRYIKGVAEGTGGAPTAEALMRSRYTAFVLGDVDYLLATHHVAYRPDKRAQLQQTLQTTQWVNLVVLSTYKGQKKDKAGIVEFAAAYRQRPLIAPVTKELSKLSTSDTLSQLHEKSRFVREGSRWLYTEGDMLPPYQPNRTHPCWCGSGLKFKQCHGG